ncbi:MAG: hypothetical protein HY554_16360 [Elusimicrobia bacterium]|nr:hypothetical protein [Elusimicrobiota bacterium]
MAGSFPRFWAALLLACPAGPAAAARGAAKAPPRAAFALDADALKRYGIDPRFIVAVRPAGASARTVIGEHLPGRGSVLHVLAPDGSHLHALAVPSPQLADFSVDPSGREAFLVGSYGTRFYAADLVRKRSRLVYASLPDRPGFRALAPVSIAQTARGPVVYGVFYRDETATLDVGFARVRPNGTASNVLSTRGWSERLGPVSGYSPHPKLESGLVVRGARSGPGKGRALAYAAAEGDGRELDAADDIYGVSWAPDGERFAYVRRRGEKAELMLGSAGGQPARLAEGFFFAPVFVDGGRSLVVGKIEGKTQGAWIVSLPEGRLERLELPAGPFVHAADPTGATLVAWGPWGLRTFRFEGGSARAAGGR